MTCHLVCTIIKRLQLDPVKIFIKITRVASKICGTTANLKENEYYSV